MVKPNESCVFKADSSGAKGVEKIEKFDNYSASRSDIYVYEKSMIDFEGRKPKIYSWNGFDREGGVLRQDSVIE